MVYGSLRVSLRFAACVVVLAGLCADSAYAARSEPLALRRVDLDLPGPPSKVIAADMNLDGRSDLVVVVAYTEVEEIDEDRVENMVMVTTVIPALFDRREVRVYLALSDGGYESAGEPLPLPGSILHLEAGPASLGVIALTDEGLSVLRYEAVSQGTPLRLEPVVDDPPLLARTGSFYPSLRLVHDLDGDGTADLLLPSLSGLAVYLGTESGLSPSPADRIVLPGTTDAPPGRASRSYPMPTVGDVDGDGLPDLMFDGAFDEEHPAGFHILLGRGDGKFGPLRKQPLDCHDALTDLRSASAGAAARPWPPGIAAVRDIDGDGRAEIVIVESKPRGESFRKGLKDVKRPIQQLLFHRLTEDRRVAAEPYFELEVVGHRMGGEEDGGNSEEDSELELPVHTEQFVDLDGDGREDLITFTLDFSVFQALRILTTKKIGIGIDFHVYAQQPDGKFRKVPNLDLSEKLKLDLQKMGLRRFAQFAGDFDGDGRQDFVHLGRGNKVTLHGGQPGCRYPKKPDLVIELEAEPPSLELVRIEDFDGDGRSDLSITRPLPVTRADTTPPVRLELYLSGGAS